MKKHSIFIPTILFLLGGFSSLNATERFVSEGGSGDGSSWANAKGSIQSAISDCVAGDVVYVSAGTYNEIVSIKDGVSVYGGYNATTGDRDMKANETILDGTDLSSYVLVKYDNDCTLPTTIEGFTLQNTKHTSDGGGAYIRGNVTLENCVICNCKGSNGGGVYVNGAGTVRNCIIELCQSTSSGGAIRNSGGLIENCIMRGNQGKYGTLRNDSGTARNCVIYNNSATVAGWPNSGGIYNPGGRIENCISARNYGNEYAAMHSNGVVQNTICWGCGAPESYTDRLAYAKDGVEGTGCNAAVRGDSRTTSAMTLNAENMHEAGPHFKQPTTFIGIPTTEEEIAAMRAADWSLLPTSPCIDKGMETSAITDILGVARPKGTAFDLGAYEYNPGSVGTGLKMTLETQVELQQSNGHLQLTSPKTMNVAIYSLLGAKVAESRQVTAAAFDLVKGIYLVKTEINGAVAAQKIIVR